MSDKDTQEERKDDGDEEVEEDKEEKPQGEVKPLARGDYLIHIYIEQAKKLKVDAGDTVDPIVEVSCMGNKQCSTSKEGIDNMAVCIWNEHIFLEYKNKEPQELEKAKVCLKLLDKGLFKDEIIGYYEFDLNWIYLKDQHALLHKWVVMSNPNSDDFSEVSAYFKCSIAVIATGDDNIAIEDDPNPDTEDIIQPPQIKPEFYQLYFRFFQAEQIVPMDIGIVSKPSTDLYFRLDYRSKKLKTKAVTLNETESKGINQEFMVPIQLPLMTSRIVIKVYDEDTVQDEIMGSIHFDLKELMGEKNKLFFWKNIYGAPKGVSGRTTDMMNENPEMASLFKGRVLMQVVAEKVEKPKMKVDKISPDMIQEAQEHYCEKRQYQISAYIQSGISLPYRDKKNCQVEIRIGEQSIQTKDCIQTHGTYARWLHHNYDKKSSSKTLLYEAPYVNVADIGSVFIYLVVDKKRVCYATYHISEFNDPESPIKWVELSPDKAIGKVKKAHEAGIIGLKLYVKDVTDDSIFDPGESPSWAHLFKNKKRLPLFKMRCYIYQCRDLPAADSDGTSDPAILVHGDGTLGDELKDRTSVIEDNMNPLFYEALELTIEASSIDELPPIIIDCMDYDDALVGKGDWDFLSRAIIPCVDANNERIYSNEADNADNNDDIRRPKWYEMRTGKNMPKSGEVLASFAIVDGDHAFRADKPHNVNLEQTVKTDDFEVKINVLGLRNLQSPGLLPVKKAFVNFNCKSLVAPKLGTNLTNIRTEPKFPGDNPTLNTSLSFSVPLPIETLFCPRLACTVYDTIFAGLSQPIIGNFVIPIGELMHSLIEERTRETQAIEDIVEELERINAGQAVAPAYNQQPQAQLGKIRASLNDGSEEDVMGADKDGLIDSSGINDALRGNEAENRKLDAAAMTPKEAQVSLRQQAQELGKTHGDSHDCGSRVQGSVKKAMKKKILEQAEKDKRDADDARRRHEEDMKGSHGLAAHSNVMTPTYEWDDRFSINREINKPPPTLFFGVGWDRDDVIFQNPDGTNDATDISTAMDELAAGNGQPNLINTIADNDDDKGSQKSKDEICESGMNILKVKHYRRMYNDELENVKDVLPVPSPFDQYDMKKGQTRGAKAGFFASLLGSSKTDASGEVSTEKVTGRFKAVIEVESKPARELYKERKNRLFADLKRLIFEIAKKKMDKPLSFDFENTNFLDKIEDRMAIEAEMEPLGIRHLNIMQKLADLESDVILKRMLLRTKKCIVRAYILDGRNFSSRDFGGASDPYLRIKVGEKEFNERDNYILDEPNPDFFKHYDFQAIFPGCPPLVISAYDYDDLFGDDLIGTTVVDLEDRYFLPEWNALKDKPIEARELMHPNMSISQGVIRCWVEINQVEVEPKDVVPIYDCTPQPPEEFELRVVIWEGEDIKMMDVEDTSDAFVKCFFDSRKDALETDTHYRLQPGKKASWNYRLIWRKEYHFGKQMPYLFSIQSYDRDFFKSNDIIGSTQIDFKQLFEDAALTKKPISLTKQYYEDQFVPNLKPGEKPWKFSDDGRSFYVDQVAKGDDGKLEHNGKILIQVDIVSAADAEKSKLGKAREEPNHSPFLPPPIGRISFSLNPWTMFMQLVGPSMRKKIYCACCLALCLALCIYIVPNVIGGLITKWI